MRGVRRCIRDLALLGVDWSRRHGVGLLSKPAGGAASAVLCHSMLPILSCTVVAADLVRRSCSCSSFSMSQALHCTSTALGQSGQLYCSIATVSVIRLQVLP